MESNFKESAQIIKASAKETVKKHKWMPIVGGIILVIAILLIALVAFLRSDSMTSKLVYSFVPEEVYIEELQQTFYSELNEDYDSSESGGDFLDMYKTYSIYKDPVTGEETKNYVEKNEIKYFGENGQVDVNLVFLARAAEKLYTVLNVIKIITAVLIVGLIVLAIYFWYLSYTKREKQAREEKYKNKNQNRHNK